jgi:two-component system, NarL family, response regulator LiaR
MSVRIAIVDDHRVVQTGLKSFLGSFPDFEVMALFTTGEEAVACIPGIQPDLVIMDLRLLGGIDGIETTRRLRQALPGLRVLVLTAHTEESPLIAALRAGALGYVRKDADPEIFLEAVRSVAAGRPFYDPAAAGSFLQSLARVEDDLTERETEVLCQLARGGTNRQIAAILGVSEETIKTHVGSILSKLQLSHRTQAAIYALKRGLVALEDVELPPG